MSDLRHPVPSIKLIFRCESNIMMLKLKFGGYDLPGGRMDYGESIFGSLRREIKEEIGLDISFESEPKLLDVTDYMHTGDGVHRLIVKFVYDVSEMFVKPAGLGEPNNQVVWFSKGDLESLDIDVDYKKSLLKAFDI